MGDPGLKHFVLVEGEAERALLERLGCTRGSGWFVKVANGGNNEAGLRGLVQAFGLDEALRDARRHDRLLSVALMFDAEEDSDARAGWLRDGLVALGLSPERAATLGHGEVAVEGNVRYGYFIAPDGRRPGAVEALLRAAVAPGVGGCVDQLFACEAVKEQAASWTLAQRDKAWLEVALRSARAPAHLRDVRAQWRATLGQLLDALPVSVADHEVFGPLRGFLVALRG